MVCTDFNLAHRRPAFDPRRAELAQSGETNQVAQVINNNYINVGGDAAGAGIPGLEFGPRMGGDICEFHGRPPMGPEGFGPMNPWADCGCGGDNELAAFGNSSMGKNLGKAAKYGAIFNGIANIIGMINPAGMLAAARS